MLRTSAGELGTALPASVRVLGIGVWRIAGKDCEQLRAAAAWLDEHENATALSMTVVASDADEVVLTMFADDGICRS